MKIKLIITGTDPSSRRGGIGFALPGYLAALQFAGIPYESIPTYHPQTPGGKWRLWLSGLLKIVRLIRNRRKNQQDSIVYSHAGAGISLLRESVVLYLGRLMGAKTIVQLHALEIHDYLNNHWQRWLFKVALLGVDVIFVLTPWWKERLQKGGVKKTIFIVPNPLPLEWENRAKTEQNKLDITNSISNFKLLTMTRLVSGKGVNLVIETMKHLPTNVQLIIAGDGTEKVKLEKQVKLLGLEQRVRFTGWVSGDIKQQLFDEADVFCLPSALDSFGMGFVEAMANGLPVVALRWGPIEDVVPDGKAGFLIDKEDSLDLAERILQLQDNNLRKQMGEYGRTWVLQQFSAEVVGKRLAEAIENLVNQKQ